MAKIEDLDERASDAQTAGGSNARLAWIASCAMIAGAAILAVGPRALPATSATVSALARNGLTWPLLAGFGVVIAAVATTARRARETTEAEDEVEHEPVPSLAQDPLAREIASELARVRGGLHDLRVEFVYVKDTLARVQQSTSQSDSDSNHESDAAIFRLAASLDQLGGRIEHELASQRTWWTEAIEAQARASAESATLPRFADPYTQAFEGPDHEIEIAGGYESSDDDLEVEVSLDDDATWVQGLGVLDEIDEPRAPIGRGPGHGRPSSPEGLLGTASGRALLDAKMAHLRALLSDPAVQRALEAQTG